MKASEPAPTRHVFSIGHSTHSLATFMALLKAHAIEVLVDVRSHPYSKHASHFDRSVLERALAGAGIRYLFLGKELGGRPAGQEFYDSQGRVLYSHLAKSASFLLGIRRLEKGVSNYRVAIMCSEENPVNCHRRLLIARVLAQRGLGVIHIRGDGQLQDESELESKPLNDEYPGQIVLFDEPEESGWKSTRSVSRRRPQRNSSAL